ncbi:DEAD-box ATP-dependent RNA helicase 58 [Arachis hypogaea]|nr:DEAD-box ATP-dependent RNA helicase 58 [Arachis hypogaea]
MRQSRPSSYRAASFSSGGRLNFEVDEMLIDKEQEQVGGETMVGTPINGRSRQVSSLVNGVGDGHDLTIGSTPPSNAGSDYGIIEFTREDVEALLNEKAKRKDRFNYKIKWVIKVGEATGSDVLLQVINIFIYLVEIHEINYILDAYVSLGRSDALNGKVTIASSGRPDAIAKAQPVLSAMYEKLFTFEGEIGGGRQADGSVPGNITENERQADQPESEGLPEDDKVEECISADKEANLCADVVAHVSEAYHFNGMFDYQYVVPVPAEVAQRKKRNWSELEEPHFGEGGLIDVDHEDIMLIVPSLFALKHMPENFVPPLFAFFHNHHLLTILPLCEIYASLMMEEIGYVMRIDVQREALPHLFSGRDCSGKVTKVARMLAAKPTGVEGEQKSCTVMALLHGGTLRRHKSWLKIINTAQLLSNLVELATFFDQWKH